MPKKTKIIFIVVFLTVGIIILGLYFYTKNSTPNTTNTDKTIYQKFNPFGTSTKVSTENTPEETNTPTENIVKEASKFHQITNFAVAGATYFEDMRLLPIKEKVVETTPAVTPEVTTTETKTPIKITNTKILPKTAKTVLPIKPAEPTTEIVPSLRYVEKATGHVYQMYLDTKVENKISNSTIPSVYETIFDSKANSIIYRYISPDDNNSITSFVASLGGKSNFLSPNILDISLSPDKSKFFSLIESKTGVTGIIKSFEETKTTQVFTSSFSEWLSQWVTDKNIYLTTKPSYLVEGSVFNLNTTNGTLSKIFGGVKGLTTLANNDGTSIIFGASLDIGPKLNLFDIKNHTSSDLNVYGLPEKCIWSSDNINVYCSIPNVITGTQYPDVWYQGLVTFDDRVVKINTQTKDIISIANSSNDKPVDATHLFLDKKESKLFFINKKDSTLWSLDL